MAKVKFLNDEPSDSYSEAENTKSKKSLIKQGNLYKDNSVDSDISANDFACEESCCMSISSDSCYPLTIDTEERVKLKDDLNQTSENFKKLDDIIDQIEKLRFSEDSSKSNIKILNSKKIMDTIDNQKEGTSLTKDDVLNSNYCSQNHQMNINIEKENDEVEERSNDADLDNRLEDQNDDDENLIARGPVRPHLNCIRNKPYDTFDWLFQSDEYSIHEYSDGQQSETSDYDTSIQQLMTDNDYRERIDSCLDQLSDSSKKSEIYYERAFLQTMPREKNYKNQEPMVSN